MTPLFFADTTDRLYPLEKQEREMVIAAFTAWTTDNLYLDNSGNYRLKNEDKKPIAPWSKLVKTLFKNHPNFHRAARRYKETGVFTDPTQTPRIVSSSNGTEVDVRVQQGTKLTVRLATVHADAKQHGTAIAVADLIANALAAYGENEEGRKEIEDVLGKLYRLNKVETA